MTERLLLSYVDLKLVLNRNIQQFCLMLFLFLSCSYPVQTFSTFSYAAATPRFIEAYNTLFSGTGKMYYNTGNDISRQEYPNGYALYAFDLMPDMCGSSPHFNVVQKGNLAIEIQFTTAHTAAISVECYGEFENTIHIDSERNLIYDYSA